MQAIRLAIRPIPISKDIRIVICKLILVCFGVGFLPAQRVLAATIVENQVDIIVVIEKSNPLLLIARERSRSRVDTLVFREGAMGTMSCVVGLEGVSDTLSFLGFQLFRSSECSV